MKLDEYKALVVAQREASKKEAIAILSASKSKGNN
jgi:hypothetical protein